MSHNRQEPELNLPQMAVLSGTALVFVCGHLLLGLSYVNGWLASHYRTAWVTMPVTLVVTVVALLLYRRHLPQWVRVVVSLIFAISASEIGLCLSADTTQYLPLVLLGWVGGIIVYLYIKSS